MHIDFVEIANFRKLINVRIGLSKEKTVFVGANNSGKSSAMLALRYFLVERERKNISFNDFSLTHWPAINAMGESWTEAKAAGEEIPASNWPAVVPFIDV